MHKPTCGIIPNLRRSPNPESSASPIMEEGEMAREKERTTMPASSVIGMELPSKCPIVASRPTPHSGSDCLNKLDPPYRPTLSLGRHRSSPSRL